MAWGKGPCISRHVSIVLYPARTMRVDINAPFRQVSAEKSGNYHCDSNRGGRIFEDAWYVDRCDLVCTPGVTLNGL